MHVFHEMQEFIFKRYKELSKQSLLYKLEDKGVTYKVQKTNYTMEKLATLLALLLYFGLVFGEISNKCVFPAIYNFGDSNSDTGGKSAAFRQVPPPNGLTFFGSPMGRVCDGRLIIDLIGKTYSCLIRRSRVQVVIVFFFCFFVVLQRTGWSYST